MCQTLRIQNEQGIIPALKQCMVSEGKVEEKIQLYMSIKLYIHMYIYICIFRGFRKVESKN